MEDKDVRIGQQVETQWGYKAKVVGQSYTLEFEDGSLGRGRFAEEFEVAAPLFKVGQAVQARSKNQFIDGALIVSEVYSDLRSYNVLHHSGKSFWYGEDGLEPYRA
jgi:hypothetical protein